jgi:hypothetical protein
MRTVFLGAIAVLLFSAAFLRADDPAPAEDNGEVYKAQDGQAPPVAPPLRKGSPLDHLANDPKQLEPTVGYREGHTTGPAQWTGHRLIDPQGGQGWGWIKPASEDWNSAKWVTIQETLGVAVAPHRKLFKADADLNWEYKFWGKFASYKAYDPRMDEQLPVFILQGYEVVGPQPPLDNKVGPPGRIQHRPSGASSREGRPILSDPGVD